MFTARYALSPYIKQIRFVFKGLIPVHLCPVTSLILPLDSSLSSVDLRDEWTRTSSAVCFHGMYINILL
jgi:hypothetical protein